MGQTATRSLAYYAPILQPALQPFMTDDTLKLLEVERLFYQVRQMIPNKEDIRATRDLVLEAAISPSPYKGLFDDDDNDDNDDDDLDEEEETRTHNAQFCSGRSRQNTSVAAVCSDCTTDDDDDDDDDEDEDEDEDDDDDDDLIDNPEFMNGGHRQKRRIPDKSRRGQGGGRRGKGREGIHCIQCHRVVNSRNVQHCPKCQNKSETYCSSECLRKGNRNHKDKCENSVQAKLVQAVIQTDHCGERFGCLEDLPGLEHEFLGGSKFSIVLKIGRRVPKHGNVFHCRDNAGEYTKLKLEGGDANLLEAASRQHPQLYVPVTKAFLQPLNHLNDHKGVVLNVHQGIQTFYEFGGKDEDGYFMINKIQLQNTKREYAIYQCRYKLSV